MCGITGIWSRSSPATDEIRERIGAMTATLGHRGPDASRIWIDQPFGIALGHRRLAIIDLSPAGNQPMFSGDGRWVMVLNGEIYNFRTLRAELASQGSQFHSASDTEVTLEAVAAWGFENTLARLGGMFALALWDRDERRLYLARDRIGKKPLYLYRGKETVLFGSELKALCAHPAFPRQMNRDVIGLFFQYHYIPAPWTIYCDTVKLMPGQYAVISEAPGGGPGHMELRGYWDAFAVAHEGTAHSVPDDEPTVLLQSEELLRDAVRQRMIADVPLGALLSGGIDSSLIAALMQTESMNPIKTFTIGFQESGFDEAKFAGAVAKHLGTDHRELYVTPRETLDVIPQLAEMYDEPFADSSQVPTWVVSKLARTQVTVALSGDGGDELFGGYNRYSWARRLWCTAGWLPISLRRRLSRAIVAIPQEDWDRLLKALTAVLPQRFRPRFAGDKAHKAARILDSQNADLLYRQLVTNWDPIDEILANDLCASVRDPLPELQGRMRLSNFSGRMMLADLMTYLPDDILAKVDRASMAVALEIRSPFLDHRVVEWAWRLPMRYKIRGIATKWLLRQILHRYVPQALVDRPKTGFGVPIGEWLRGPLREWGEALLNETRLAQEGVLCSDVVSRYWREHQSGKRNWQYRLWSLLMFQAWKNRWQPC